MKKAIFVILTILLCLSVFTGCVEKRTFTIGSASEPTPAAAENSSLSDSKEADALDAAKADDDTAEDPEELEDSEPGDDEEADAGDAEETDEDTSDVMAEIVGPVYQWEDVSFGLTDLLPDEDDYWVTMMGVPGGKWVEADFTITEGRINLEQLNALVTGQNGILLGEYVAGGTSVSINAIEIDGDDYYVSGSFIVLFDVPVDYEPDTADIYVDESVTAAAE